MKPLTHAVCVGEERAVSHRARRALGAGPAFLGICALLFVASVAATLAMHASMSTMGALPMPGGWSMSSIWTPVCGQTRLRVAASFIRMWTVMMAAMMLPSLAPMLSRYREAVGVGMRAQRLGVLTLLVGIGYFAVWSALGVAVFAPGAALAMAALQSRTLARAMPIAAGFVMLLAGAFQRSAWKARHLACCPRRPCLHLTLGPHGDTVCVSPSTAAVAVPG